MSIFSTKQNILDQDVIVSELEIFARSIFSTSNMPYYQFPYQQIQPCLDVQFPLSIVQSRYLNLNSLLNCPPLFLFAQISYPKKKKKTKKKKFTDTIKSEHFRNILSFKLCWVLVYHFFLLKKNFEIELTAQHILKMLWYFKAGLKNSRR